MKPGVVFTAKWSGVDAITGKPFSAGATVKSLGGRNYTVVTLPKKTGGSGTGKIQHEQYTKYQNETWVKPEGREGEGDSSRILRQFPSVAHFLRAIDGVATTRRPSECASLTQPMRKEWCDNCSYPEALESAYSGNPAYEHQIESLVAEIRQGMGHAEQRIRRVAAIAGGSPNIGGYLRNDPECMYRFRRSKQSGDKILTLHSNIFYSSMVNAVQIARRGAAVAALAILLEEAGYQVCLNAVGSLLPSRGGSGAYNFLLTLKAPGEIIDLKRVAFVMAHPAFFRRLMLRHFELQPEPIIRNFCFYHRGGYSYPDDKTAGTIGTPDLYIPGNEAAISETFGNTEAARRWIIQQIVSLGIAYPDRGG